MNDRARVPFALVGVVLLVGSATLSASMAGHDPVTEPRTEAALEEGRAATLTALRRATRTAARHAARQPVVATANTTVGRAVNGTDPFRAYLALRIHERFRDALTGVRGNSDVSVDASLSPVANASTLRAALDRTTVRRGDRNGTVRVTVENVTLTARRNGQVVERIERAPSVTVRSPVLRLHDRTTRFDRRLDRPATRPGLARRTTARLYGIAWSRGYTQYAGGPVVNVVANRHVSLAVNHALLAEQRAAFGRVDATANRGVSTLAARTLGTDLLAASGYTGTQATYLRERIDDATRDSTLAPLEATNDGAAPGPESTLTVEADGAATAAFRGFVDGRLDTVLDRTYAARVRLRAATDTVSTTDSGRQRPGPEWTLVESRRQRTTDVERRAASAPRVEDGWHALAAYGRRVTERTVVHRRWRSGNRTTTTRSVTTRTVDVRLAVVGDHASVDGIPDVPIHGVHTRGRGALSGPNLAGVERRAVERLVTRRGGVDDLAERVVAGSLDTTTVRVAGTRPPVLREWVYRDLRRLRERVANRSVTVERGAVGTYAVNPAAELAATLDARRETLVGRPEHYDGVAAKARHAARVAYLNAVVAQLERRAAERRGVGQQVDQRLAAHGSSLAAVRGAMNARRSVRTPGSAPSGREFVVDGAPPVLLLRAVDRERLDVRGDGAYRGLAARNLNVFTAPHGDAADTVVGALFGPRTVRLRTAVETLRAARGFPDAARTKELRTSRRQLRSRVAAAVERRRGRFRARLAAAGVGDSPRERRRLVTTALARWERLPARALALVNGSAADAVVRLARQRHPAAFEDVETRDRLRLALRAAGTTQEGIPEPAVNRTATTLTDAGSDALREYAKRAAARAINATAERVRSRVERRLGRSLARVPAGLPVTPVPASWYATTNLWLVEVRGAYARFSVRSRRGTPGKELRYVRDGSAVRFDWDGDGTREVVGRSSRVDLSVQTAVVVVVPPGGRGVGDTDGNADERSAGWNTAGT